MIDTSLFMASFRDDKTLADICIPGSHDAGIFNEGASANAKTQDGTLQEQCMAGSRFFDLRVIGDRFYHGKTPFGKKAMIGSYGANVTDSLEGVSNFLSARGSEFVILRFDKCHDKQDLEDGVREIFEGKLLCQTGNIATMNIGLLRGKAICIFSKTKTRAFPQEEGIHQYLKGIEPCDTGLAINGKFSDNPDSTTVLTGQLGKLDAFNDQNGAVTSRVLHSLYWQQTLSKMGAIRNKSIEEMTKGPEVRNRAGRVKKPAGVNLRVDELVDELNERKSVRYKMPNIIQYDFVCKEISDKIISLNNPYKPFTNEFVMPR
ncbi:hypothetical protein [Stieleria sp.]|uniref:hypothetical protein n=1 Tax=Stieleria sp. TaxID=2795976 RepID=UPI00356799B1